MDGFRGLKSMGFNRREFWSWAWGPEDWADEERLQNQLGTNREIGKTVDIEPVGPKLAHFTLHPDEGKTRTRAIDNLLKKHGIR